MKSVLVFDSGVGGLSIFEQIATLLPQQHIVYAFDNEAFPYGELADDVLIARVCGMISSICAQQKISLVVIACNTASTLVLPSLRSMLTVPVVGVVPAIKPAAMFSKTKKIGLLATPATIKRSYTHQLIEEFAPDCDVKLLGSTALVQMGEAKLRGLQPDMGELQQILTPFINQVDCVVLGCTHFPLLKVEIEQVLGESCKIVDSGKAIALRVKHLLAGKSDIVDLSHFPHLVMSSSAVSQEKELNHYLSTLHFSDIIRCPAF